MERADYAVSLILKAGNWLDTDGLNKECLRGKNKDWKSVALDVKRGTGAADFFSAFFFTFFLPSFILLSFLSVDD